MSSPVPSGDISPSRRLAGFVIAGLAGGVMMASSSAPSPFYPVLQREMGFSETTLTAIFAVYAIVLLATLLTGGSASDHIGRRPVLSFGFALLAASMLGFALASGPEELLAARAVQGVACALLLTTASAAVTDLEPRSRPGLAQVCNSVIPLAGMAAGAPLAGFVMEHAAEARLDVFVAITLICLGFAALVWKMPETSPRHEGLWQALLPRVGIPAPARAAFWQSTPAIVAGWATGGLYLSLGAPVISVFFGIESYLIQALVVTLLSGVGALACFIARRYSPRQVMLYGTFALALGTALTLTGIWLRFLPLYLAALTLAGTGFGTCFYASLRTIVPLCPPDERGELFASIFTLSYLAFGLPVVAAGFAIPRIGLDATVLIYGLIITLMAALAWAWRRFGSQS
ncbi:MFS transporter [Pseudogemmobacter bohemicus]|uniref:MFS transporter n=1 Tax=Pseudogemmobacter bohemicus TaxID=2250708 RepID=UPI000DD3002E|nr:MFS transporter [Pseudogemmobacter bohemicus]